MDLIKYLEIVASNIIGVAILLAVFVVLILLVRSGINKVADWIVANKVFDALPEPYKRRRK